MASCQQGPLYDAEGRALMRLPGLRRMRLTQGEAQALLDEWREFPWFRENFPKVGWIDLSVRKTSSDGSCGGIRPLGDGPREIAVLEMAPVHMNPLYLAHELAHPLSISRYGSRSHDPWFSRTYLQLVYLALGSSAYQALYEEFEVGGIDHKIDE